MYALLLAWEEGRVAGMAAGQVANLMLVCLVWAPSSNFRAAMRSICPRYCTRPKILKERAYAGSLRIHKFAIDIKF